jgi:hypothetical protein
MNETFLYKTYSDESKFTAEGNKIQLREYENNLVFYHPCSSIKAEFSLGNKTGESSSDPVVYDHGKFASCIKVSSPIKYGYENFESLNNKGRISFYTGVNTLDGFCSQYIDTSAYPAEGLPKGTYSLNIKIEDSVKSTIVAVELDHDGTTLSELRNKFLFTLDPTIYDFELDYTDTVNITFKSLIKGKLLTISNGTTGTDLLSLFSLGKKNYACYPETDISIFTIGNGTDDKSKIDFKHISKTEGSKKVSYIKCTMFDNDGKEASVLESVWDNDGVDLSNIELDFNSDLSYLFIDGELKSFGKTGFERKNNSTFLVLGGSKDETYTFDEIIIKCTDENNESFTPSTTALTKYYTGRPYIDFHFSGKNVKDKNLNTLYMDSSSNIHCILYADDVYYYYYQGSWRPSDGTFEQSNDYETFTSKISSFPFTGADFYIRAIFDSDGTTPAYINSIYFTIEETELVDQNGDSAAVLIGDKSINEDVDLDGKTLVITTASGETSIPFTGKMNADDIINAINSASPEGITKAGKNGTNNIFLVSTSTGEEAYIKVSGDAAPIIFGSVTSAQGTNASDIDTDYSAFYEDVKSYYGAPLIAFEVTKHQLDLFIQEAINLYNRYRTDNMHTVEAQLKGNAKSGYTIPSIIGDYKNIVDIFFKPIFPLTFYGSDFEDGDDIISLLLARNLFGGAGTGGIKGGFTQDYYISLMNIENFRQTIGLNPSWEILNDKLYIYPSNLPRFTHVCIKYKATASMKHMLKDPEIIQYVTGKCLMMSGSVRSSLGGQLSTGINALQFNGDTMYERGKNMCDAALDSLKHQQEPLGFFMG